MERWKEGQLLSLLSETGEIQSRLKPRPQKDIQNDVNRKMFTNLMLLGKLGDAAKKINNDDSIKGVHQLTEEIKNILQQKNPQGQEPKPEVILLPTSTPPEPVIYEEITADIEQPNT